MGTVRVEDRSAGVRVLTLDRPPANAENETLLADLLTAIEEAGADPSVRAVVLTGAGKFFSGGFDLSAPRRDDEEVVAMTALYRDAHVRLLTLPKPTIAMMKGHAIAGGLVLVLACDYRLGLDGDYRIGLNEVAIGAVLSRRWRSRSCGCDSAISAPRSCCSARRCIPASQALRLGIVDELLPADKLEETVMRRAARMGAFPREAYAHAKPR